jgi:hypothetical protein
MEIVEVKLLQYTFRFRKLSWREEFGIKFDPKEDRIRTILAFALTDISGFKINTVDEARSVLAAIPPSITERVYIIWQGSMPNARMFSTMGLWKAPEAARYQQRVKLIEEEREEIMDRAEAEMEKKFGVKELREARARERLMVEKSKGRGLTKATPDE